MLTRPERRPATQWSHRWRVVGLLQPPTLSRVCVFPGCPAPGHHPAPIATYKAPVCDRFIQSVGPFNCSVQTIYPPLCARQVYAEFQ